MACKNFFSFNFPLPEYFFCTSPAPPPHKFSNGPSLTVTQPPFFKGKALGTRLTVTRAKSLFLRIMWVFEHLFTCQPTSTQLETFNLIGVNQEPIRLLRKCNPIKSSKVNGNGKKHLSVPEVFLAASAVGQHRKFSPHARKT